MMTIEEIMTRDPLTVDQCAGLNDASEMMQSNRIRHLPVVDEEGSLVGLVTQRDFLAAIAAAKDQSTLTVGDVMRKKVQSIDESTELRSAALTMQRNKIGCLPVLREGKLIGIITDSDYVGLAINLLEQLESMEPPEFDDDDYDMEGADELFTDDEDF